MRKPGGQGSRKEPAAIREIVPGVLRGLKPHSGPLVALRRGWAGVVGLEVARRTRVVTFESGVLGVEVESAALKHHLAVFRRDEILTALSACVGPGRLRAIRYRVGVRR